MEMNMSLSRLTTLAGCVVALAVLSGCNDQAVVDKATTVANQSAGDADLEKKDVDTSANASAKTRAKENVQPKKNPAPPAAGYLFEKPFRIKAGDEYIAVESPGYACPTMADVDGDGLEDLVVGQFNKGLMWFCKNVAESPSETPQFDKADWIRSDGEPAEVPGVW